MLVKNRLFCQLALAMVLLTTTGCQFTQAAFPKMAGNAGAAFAAAALTLSYAHEGKITSLYAQSSFQNYQSELDGLDQQLPSQQGSPGSQSIQNLLHLYKPAIQAVDRPCLDSECDWRMQVKALNTASQAFLKAGGQ